MVQVVFIAADGSRRDVDVTAGTSVMQAAILNNVNGIVGECGGAAMCATCHVYIDPEFAQKVPPRSEIEEVMLEATASEADDRSRLGCQIVLGDELDGLTVHLPPTQY